MKHSGSSGFTLFELIMVIVITGVLAIAVAPRFFDRNAYEDKGFADETVSILRYAQKAAIAQRRTVCVTFTATTVTLSIAVNAGALCPGSSAIALVSPTGASPFQVSAKGGAKFSPQPADFKFNALGQPLDASGTPLAPPATTIRIVDSANTQVAQILVEAETGYVH